jgi:replicative DNA helicase
MSEAEESVVGMIGATYSGHTSTEDSGESPGDTPFEFDEAFQERVAALTVRDSQFMTTTRHLIKPEYFEDVGDAAMVNMVCRFWDRFKAVPDKVVMAQLIKDDVAAGIVRKELVPRVVEKFKAFYGEKVSLTGREYVAEKVAEFVRHQAVGKAILASVDLIEKGQFGKVEEIVKKAVAIGTNESMAAYDFWGKIEERAQQRIDKVSGAMPLRGITTGMLKLDELLYHRGWGRKELVTLMGGAKSGKTTGLVGFAKCASLAGYNVLYVTLEVSAAIISDRLDACITSTEMQALLSSIRDVESKLKTLQARAGKLLVHEYPTGTLTPAMLEALIERYRNDGVIFDLLAVDYADIMAPNIRTQDSIENSKSIYVDLRAICQKHDLAGLTATQTNRDGMKAAVATMVHVSDDINKMRIVDLAISINLTDEERSRGEARLYFAASRNQASGFTVFIKQDVARMKFIESIVRVE